MPAERLYYADSALTQFTATVTDIRERSRTGGISLWQIALDRSAFYPTSGGQPHDSGTLAATAPSGARLEAPVVGVEEDEQGEIWHLTPKPLLAGTQVEGSINWSRRLDHMQQHSGQHLLSALFYQELHALTVSFHLGDAVSTIDLKTESLEPAQLAHIERLANAIVAEARSMAHQSISAEEAQRLLAEGNLRKLPPRGGDIRIIVIPGNPAAGAIPGNPAADAIPGAPEHPSADLDVNACGGTHVTSTSQIGAVLIRGTERIRQSVRVSFLCGNRAIAAARADDALLTQLGRELSVGRADLPAAVSRMKAESKIGAKERQALREDLANYHAARLIVEDPPQNDLRIVRRIFPDRDAEYVKLLASRVVTAAPHTVAVLASTQQQPAPATVVMACRQEPGRNAGELLRAALAASGGRGGGSITLAQGLVSPDELGNALDALEAQLRRPVPAS
ncbi:MAG TPA: alanyl-tRNA editing protein [Acidobacteriaceae bacterium]|jgi:alanyl-tRNA synthetase|nr:alanyl-tRNA editing protein [Acidobacteriaceae bacterium]